MKKILITGAGGFIGRNLAEKLREEYEIDAPGHGALELADAAAVEACLRKGRYDIVLHCANVNTTKRDDVAPYASLDGNLRMFYNLERCRGYYGKMYYFGSGAEYDMRYYIPMMEEEYLGRHIPADPYGFSKYIMARQACTDNNIYELVLFGVFGKHEEWNRRFISNNIYNNLYYHKMTLTQNCYFDYIYIDDLIKVVKWFLEHEPSQKRYHVCRGEKIDLLSLAQMINHIMGTENIIEIKQEGWKREYTGSNRRLRDEIGELSFLPFEEAIYRLIQERTF